MTQYITKGFLWGVGITLGIMTTTLAAVTISGIINSFAAGDSLNAAKMNENFTSLSAAIASIPEWTKSGSDAVYNAGNVGIGTTPTEKLEVNGNVKFTPNGSIISRAPRVVRTVDNRSGCPPTAAAGSTLLSQDITLNREATVYVTVSMVRYYFSGRADLELLVDNVTMSRHITFTDIWATATPVWSGTLAAGTHTISLKDSYNANIWGCGAEWGHINTLIFE